MKKISLVITDLDNTLWDWFGIWHASFSAMLDELQAVTHLPREQLMRDIQVVHQKHHTSEYSFILQEIECLRKHLGREIDPWKDFPTVIAASQEARRAAAGLYPTVRETLLAIKAKGARIVGFTESQIFYTSQRIRDFGLDGIIDVLYSTPDQQTLSPEELEKLRKHPADYYELKSTVIKALPDRMVKPSPHILETILCDENANKADCIYIGDSLTKDIAMASACKVTSVYAEYGVSTNRPGYDLLRSVTHWSPDAVERERLASTAEVQPCIVLKQVFAEVMAHFDFLSREDLHRDLDREMEAWKETVCTQRHFNELQLSLRNILVTLLTGVVGAAGYALTQHSEMTLFGLSINLASMIAAAGFVAVTAISHFDRGYHALLLGAVANGVNIEKRLQYKLPGIGLAHSIGTSSNKLRYLGIFKQSSIWRFRAFYYTCYGLLIAIASVSFFSGTSTTPEQGFSSSDAALTDFYASSYPLSVEQAVSLAKHHLEEAIKQKPANPTMVCDIYDTALSTWPLISASQFKHGRSSTADFARTRTAEAIRPVLRLYEYALSQQVEVVFICSFGESMRPAIEANLQRAGFHGPHKVVLSSRPATGSNSQFKLEQIQKIRESGGTVVLNLGDQMSDLSLPPASYDFLIPNPFYKEL